MLRSVLAVLAGYATMAALVAGTTAALAKLWPSSSEGEAPPTPAYTAVNLAYSGLSAAIGGYVTATLARHSPIGHAAALSTMILGLGALYSAQSSGGKQPGWYLALLPALASGGVFAGGYINARSRRSGH